MAATRTKSANGRSATEARAGATAPRRVPVALFALSVGVIITNVFAPQILIGRMAASFGLREASGGLIAMIPLLGYAMGLFFLVPLSDLVETRRLVVSMLGVATLAAAGIVLAPGAGSLFALLFILGAACSANQVLMPAAAAMTEPEHRGRVLGDIMSGLMIGILLSRPIASVLAGTWGWKAYYVASATSMALLATTLALSLPERRPVQTSAYPQLIGSLWDLFKNEPVLRQRSISAAIVMAAFNFYWTTIVYVLQGTPLELSPWGIGVFALVGAGGAFVTPLAGRLADRGLGTRVTTIAHVTLMAGFGLAALSGLAVPGPNHLILVGLGFSALMLDMGVLGDQTVGRYLINQLRPEARGRINAIFVGVFFIGGAIGSAVSGMLWATGGWAAVCFGGVCLGLLALATRK
ncbi:MFS transporter [Singulisphaera rosea]